MTKLKLKPLQQRKLNTLEDLRAVQRQMVEALFRPLNRADGMQARRIDGRSMQKVAAGFIKPNDRLTSFERLEIYNKQYWFRILGCFYEDYPGLRAAIGEVKFDKIARAYLTKFPSQSYDLRNLGSRFEKFLLDEPHWLGKQQDLGLDLARFEWAEIVAFDGEAKAPMQTSDLIGVNPSQLRLKLQPYISLLELNYPVNDYLLALRKRVALNTSSGVTSGRLANNAVSSVPKPIESSAKRMRLPKRQKTFIGVHRCENIVYYKLLNSQEFRILDGLNKDLSLESACMQALSSVNPDQSEADWARRIQQSFSMWTEFGWFWQ